MLVWASKLIDFGRYLGALEAHRGYLEGLLAPLVEARIWGRILGYILGGPGSLGESAGEG